MDQPQVISLNQGQQAAADGFFQFLLSKDKEIILSGPAGVGKTFLMGYLIDEIMKRYFDMCALMGTKVEYNEVQMTATTNKAVEALSLATNRPCQTIQSFLNLKVADDHVTGKSKLTKTGNWIIHFGKIIFIDECSMVDTPLRNLIREGTSGCKIVYVGDHCQLGPVMEKISPIYKDGLPFFELSQPMRNAGQPALVATSQQLRNTVETGVFNPIQIVPGVIDWVDDNAFEQELLTAFSQPTVSERVLAYTNARVVQFNEHIRGIRNLPNEYTVGEVLLNNAAIRLKTSMLSVEDEIQIEDQSQVTEMIEIEDGVNLEVRRSTIRNRLGMSFTDVPLPVDREHYLALIKYYGQRKNWNRYFHLKNTYPDLRQRDAGTVHKAQGSTYDTVYIDVGNLSTCHQPEPAARLLYVGFTRARNRVVLYGELAEKYGGLVY